MSDVMTDFDPFADLSDDELDAMLESGEMPDFSGTAGPAPLCADVPEGFRSGFVALVGRPNAGKSTLLNACYGEKVAITSPVAQTTRRRLRAVVNREDCQLVIVDTPGIHKPKDGLGSELNKSALGELADVDVIAFVIDASAPIGVATHGWPSAWLPPSTQSARSYQGRPREPEQMLKQIEAARELVNFDDGIVVSSTEGFNVEAFVDVVARFLPQGPRWFPEGMGTDEADEVLVAEFVREKVLLRTREEIPHAVGVICDEFERPKRDLLRLHATVYVEREVRRHPRGKAGEMIKRIGIEARRDLERMFGCRVYLGWT